jgi:hypothetical protein
MGETATAHMPRTTTSSSLTLRGALLASLMPSLC